MTTDRAKRYKANRDIQDDPKSGCLFCGSKRNLTVDHLSGDENDSDPRNLVWACKSCNTRKGVAFRKAGIGRLTHQYNPNPYLGLDPQERKNFEQLGFSFPPRREYDEARAAEKARAKQEHKETLARRKQARAEAKRRKKADIFGYNQEQKRERERAKRQREFDTLTSAYAMNPPIKPAAIARGEGRQPPLRSAQQWSEAVAAVLGAKSPMTVRSAASRIRATAPGQRRKLAQAMRPNPGKVPTYAQYAFAVSGFDHGRGDPALGEIIHRTPKAKRAEYARRIAGAKREHGTEHMTGRYRETVPF